MPAWNPPAPPTPGAGASWHRSDAAELEQLYVNQPDRIARNRRLVAELKSLYGSSQVAGDQLPPGLPQAQVVEVLEVHHIRSLSKGGADERSNMIVVTASLHALIHADADCHIDLQQRTMVLFGVRLALNLDPKHP